jgi:putative endonuclease
MPSPRSALGRLGEQCAADYLTRAGYRLIARNWRCRLGEIDLVALQGDQFVFVEVKTRRGRGQGPEESVGPAKARRLQALACAYLEAAGVLDGAAWRIDVVAVEIDGAGRLLRLEQIESAVAEG